VPFGPVPTNIVLVSFRLGDQLLVPSTRGYLDFVGPGSARTIQIDLPGRQKAETFTFSAKIVYTTRYGFRQWSKRNAIATVWKEAYGGQETEV